MAVDFPQILKESKIVQTEDFIKATKEVIQILDSDEGNSENITITDKLVKLEPIGDALVIGDLHGDLESLSVILEKSSFLTRMSQTKEATLIFLGDYGDRGAKSPDVFYVVFSLKLAFPNQVVLLRGNHEGPTDLLASPHDLPTQLEHKFKEKWVATYAQIRELFSYLYNAVYVEERYLMVHGGVPAKIRNIEEIAQADKLHPDKTILEELLWNDPDEQVNGVFSSPRGAGNLFGKTVTKEILQKLNAKILIRGHEPARDGFKINHDGKVLTLFSRKGPPYFNAYGSYLDLPLAKKFENANQLLPYIHKF